MIDKKAYHSDLLFDHASELGKGCIVELGSFRGAGTIVLARGARAGCNPQVFTIDDYAKRINWAGGRQGPDDKYRFITNLRDAGVTATLIQNDAHEVSKTWTEPIGLLYWDLGDDGRFADDWNDWSKYIVRGGAAIIKDAPSNIFGTHEIIEEIIKGDDFIKENYGYGITVLRRSL